LFGHGLFGKPLHTFPDHALAYPGLTAAQTVGDEVFEIRRHRSAIDITAAQDFLCDIFGDVGGPVLERVEGENADRIGTSQRPNSRRHGNRVARRSSIPTAKPMLKLSATRNRVETRYRRPYPDFCGKSAGYNSA